MRLPFPSLLTWRAQYLTKKQQIEEYINMKVQLDEPRTGIGIRQAFRATREIMEFGRDRQG